jgi:hypothetical protein
MYDRQPTLALLTAYTRALEREQLDASMRGQQAMQQAANTRGTIADEIMSRPVMAASGGIMQGYAGGGAVAFQSGGFLGYNRDYEDARRLGIDLSPYDPPAVRAEKLERVKKMREFEKSMSANKADIPVDTSKLFPGGPPEVRMPIPEIEVAPAAARRPGTGIAQSRPQQRPPAAPAATEQGLGSFVEQTGTPARDRWAELEASGTAGIRALQDVARQQGTVDPELAKLREAAYKSSQDIAARRERDRLAMLEAGQKQYDDITDLIAGAAGEARGKTFADVLSGAARGAGAARTAKRAEFQKVKELSRQEQNAIDQLNQALADKRVADRSGDVDKRREADRKVAEAELKVTDLGISVQKERATEEDRKKQRALEEKRIATTVSEGALDRASRERLAKAAQTGDSRRVFDTLMDNARAEFEKWEKSPEGARAAMNPQAKEAKRVEFLEKQVALAKAAGVQGLDPLLAAVRSPQAGAGSTGRVVDFSSIK